MIAAFDLDGTLFSHNFNGRPPYDDPVRLAAVTEPILTRCRLVRLILAAGSEVHFVTGRGQVHYDHTLAAIRTHIHPLLPAARLHCQPEWTGYDDMARWKAEVLNRIRADYFVGDHAADRDAARQAIVPYTDHQDFFAAPRTVLA